MKIGLKGISALSFVMAAAFVGCGKPPVESYCAKQLECSSVVGLTEEQCTANVNSALGATWKDAGCKETAAALDGALSCLGGLSCGDLNSNQASQKCSDELGDVVAAYAKEQMTCKTAFPNGLPIGSDTGTGTGDGT